MNGYQKSESEEPYYYSDEKLFICYFILITLLCYFLFHFLFIFKSLCCDHNTNNNQVLPIVQPTIQELQRIKVTYFRFISCSYQKECPICLVSFKENEILARLECHHYFHRECLKGWVSINMSCPLCRYAL